MLCLFRPSPHQVRALVKRRGSDKDGAGFVATANGDIAGAVHRNNETKEIQQEEMLMKRALFALLALAVSAGAAPAQDKFPSQPIRIINAFAAGGATDITLRTAAEELREILGVNVVVENKPGANGIIAMEDVGRRRADGYTLLGGPSSMTSGLLTIKQKLSFTFEDKFTIISPVGEGPPSMILVRKELGLKDWKSFVAYSKANPGRSVTPAPARSPDRISTWCCSPTG
jgi:tripartite-type tricarboxylate transporter receptor subunit TctC